MMGMMGMMMGGAQQIELTEEQKAKAAERAAAAKANQEPAPDAEFKFVDNGVTEDMMIEYITSRTEVLEKARLKIRLQHSRIKSLENRLALAEKKNETLRDAMAKMREELKAVKAEAAELKAAQAPAEEQPVEA